MEDDTGSGLMDLGLVVVVFTTPPVKEDFKIPIFIIVFNIWPFGVIFGCYGTLSDDSDSA